MQKNNSILSKFLAIVCLTPSLLTIIMFINELRYSPFNKVFSGFTGNIFISIIFIYLAIAILKFKSWREKTYLGCLLTLFWLLFSFCIVTYVWLSIRGIIRGNYFVLLRYGILGALFYLFLKLKFAPYVQTTEKETKARYEGNAKGWAQFKSRSNTAAIIGIILGIAVIIIVAIFLFRGT